MPSKPEIKEIPFMPSTIETVDGAVLDWLDETLNLHASTNKGFKKVPVIWVSGERSHQLKDRKTLRDSEGILKLPLITLGRDSITKDPSFKGVAWAHLPNRNDAKGGAITIARRIAQTPTSKYKSAAAFDRFGQYSYPNSKGLTSYEVITTPIPTYLRVMYTIGIRTEYQQQANDILTPFATRTGQIDNFFVEKDGHKFEGFIEGGFAYNTNVVNMGTDERFYETMVSIKLLAYLLTDGPNAERPKVTVRETPAKVVQVRERSTLSDSPDFLDDTASHVNLSKRGFYKE